METPTMQCQRRGEKGPGSRTGAWERKLHPGESWSRGGTIPLCKASVSPGLLSQ